MKQNLMLVLGVLFGVLGSSVGFADSVRCGETRVLTKSKYAYFGTHYCLSTQDRAKLEVEWSKLEAKAQASLDALTVRYSDACKALGGLADVDGESAVAQGRKKVHFGGRGNPAAGYTYCMMTTAVSEQVSCQCGTAE